MTEKKIEKLNIDQLKGRGCCSDRYLQLITENVDGILTGYKVKRLQKHISKCPDCERVFKASCIASNVMKSVKIKYVVSEEVIDKYDVSAAQQQLIQSIRNEAAIRDTDHISEKNDSVKDKYLKKRLVYALSGSSAVVVLMIAFIVLWSGVNDSGFLKQNRAEYTDELTVESTTATDNSKNSYDYNDEKDTGKDSMLAPEGIGSLVASLNEQISNEIEEAVSVSEHTYDDGTYILILEYDKEHIHLYFNSIKSVLDDLGKETAIEMISGDNPRKLIEYIGTQTTEDDSELPVTSETDYLVISIGR